MHNNSTSQAGGPLSDGLHAEKGATITELTGKRVFRLRKKGRGGDPVGMLNAVLTHDVPKEGPAGRYALLLDAKGRIQTDVTVARDGEDLLVVTEEAGAEAALAILGRYAPFSRVELTETDLSVTGVYGGGAQGLFGTDLAEHECDRIEFGRGTVFAIGVAVPMRGLLVVSSSDTLREVEGHLTRLGAARMSAAEYETSRIEAGVPLFGKDVTPENFPAEAGLEKRAVSFTKGCYPGQETVARTHYRGQPNKRLYRFTVHGEASPGVSIVQDNREVGYITSVAPLEIEGRTYALGYVKRKADTNGEFTAGDAKLEASAPDRP